MSFVDKRITVPRIERALKINIAVRARAGTRRGQTEAAVERHKHLPLKRDIASGPAVHGCGSVQVCGQVGPVLESQGPAAGRDRIIDNDGAAAVAIAVGVENDVQIIITAGLRKRSVDRDVIMGRKGQRPARADRIEVKIGGPGDVPRLRAP